jgi:hypothetical protein
LKYGTCTDALSHYPTCLLLLITITTIAIHHLFDGIVHDAVGALLLVGLSTVTV